MKRLKMAKQEYDNIQIPEELSQRITKEVENSKKAENKNAGKYKVKPIRKWTVAAAACLGIFTFSLNVSESFAKEMSSVPVIGGLAEVLTFRSYETETEDLKIKVEIPSIEMISSDFQELEELNKEIYTLCEQYAEEAKQRAKEYKQAFLETGGTEEQWIDHNIEIKVWYEVKAQTEQYLSLAIIGTENWTSAYSETRFFNVDLKSGEQVTLETVLGEDYIRIAEESIRSQIKEREKISSLEYWEEEWEGINENTKFYINEERNPVVVLDKYEITAGYAGAQEFEIVNIN